MPIIKTYYKVHRVFPDPDYFYLQNTSASTATFTVLKNGYAASTDLSYSLDKVTWTDIHDPQGEDHEYRIENVAPGAKVYLRSSTGMNLQDANGYRIDSSEQFDAGGHIYTLVDYTTNGTSIPDYCFSYLFQQSKIVHADIDFSGITTIGVESFRMTFWQCSNLITPPDLSYLTTVGRYGLAFMFYLCTSLQTPVDVSNVTSNGDYGMNSLYDGCTLLNEAIAPNVSSWDNGNNTSGWLNGTAAAGVVRKPAGLTIPTDSVSGVPTGWTTENY